MKKGRTLTRELGELPVGPSERYRGGPPYGKDSDTGV